VLSTEHIHPSLLDPCLSPIHERREKNRSRMIDEKMVRQLDVHRVQDLLLF
jgi:hypothetical protein